MDNNLTPEQTMWIFSIMKDFTDRHMQQVPLSDEQWITTANEMRDIHKRSNNNKLVMMVLVSIYEYLEQIGRDNNEKEI